MARITETILCENDRPEVDRNDGVIRNVRILGAVSKNGRRYTEAAMTDAARLYSSVSVNIDHISPGQSRPFAQFSGQLEDVRYVPAKQAVFGDLHVLRSHPMANAIFEAAERFPRSFGLSHDAEGEMDGENVTSLAHVHSVDIVTKPATNRGLFEQTNTEVTMAKTTIGKIKERTTKVSDGWRSLIEMLDGDDSSMEVADVAPDSTPEDQIKAGVMAAINAKLSGADAGTLTKVLKALGISDKVSDAVSGGGDAPAETVPTDEEASAEDPMTPSEEDDKKMEEQAQRIAYLEAKTALLESGREATDERILAVSLVPQDKRAALVESWPRTSAGGTRPDGAPPKYTTNGSARAEFKARNDQRQLSGRN